MKKLYITVLVLTAFIVLSCKNKVDLYTDDGDHTIVYAILNPNADTNYFKITKSFVGNVNEYGHDYDANNYKYDEIEVTFSGNFVKEITQNGPITTVVPIHYDLTLDTISKYIEPDENSQFYNGCWQTYYYTTEKLIEGEEYTLKVTRKTDNAVISSQATTINAFRFKKPIPGTLSFSDVPTVTQTVEWKVDDPSTLFKTTAAYFEINAYIHFTETQPGKTPEYKSIRWRIASGEADKLFTSSNNDYYYLVRYAPSSLYSMLGNNTYLQENSPVGVSRVWEDFEFRVDAIGEELYNYYLITNSTSAIQDVPNYTNIENGMGIMSSRYSVSTFHRLNQVTRKKIENDFPQYGFVHDPNP